MPPFPLPQFLILNIVLWHSGYITAMAILRKHRMPPSLTAQNRVLVEKVIFTQVVKFPTYHGIYSYINMLTACHWTFPASAGTVP